MTFFNLSTAVRRLAVSGTAALFASLAAAQGLRPPPDFDMPMGTKPLQLPKTLSGMTSGPVTMARIATYGACPISFPYALTVDRKTAFAKFVKDGFKHITLPPPAPGAPPIEFLERTTNGIYQKITVNGRRRGGGGSTAVLTESVPQGAAIPKGWPKVARISFAKFTLAQHIPGTVLRGRVPDRVVLVTGTWDQPTCWDIMYALPVDYNALWSDIDRATNTKDWSKRGHRTWGEIYNKSYQMVSKIDLSTAPPMRSEGLKAKSFAVLRFLKR